MILVTGSRGFLGKYFVKELRKVRKRLFLTTSHIGACGIEYHYLNMEEPESFKNLPDSINTVVHLAAAIPKKNETITFSKFMEVNAYGVKRLIEETAKRGCQRFIYASTQMVIEKPFYLPVDEDHPFVPMSNYGLTKAIGERYCLESKNEIGGVALRFVRIYGAGENPGFVLTNFIERAEKGLPLVIHGYGKVQRDMIYVKDAVLALMKALNSDATGVFNIGGGRGISIRELALTVAEVFGGGVSKVVFKEDMLEGGEDFYQDTTKAREGLGFIPRYSLLEGLADYRQEIKRLNKA